MCGIGGWLGHFDNSKGIGERMAQALRHRGPDAFGIRSWTKATLVHTRLSIIDLSQAGAQPLANENGTVWTVFNGEIYNHREIQKDLERKGHVFKGYSDTEVLPHLYEEEGWEFVKSLRGMFSLAIYDVRTQTMILARDRFGIKPLFYAFSKGKRLSFASELRALLTLPGIDTSPDRQAIFDFAALSYIPAPETFYKGIRALQPGEILVAQLVGEQVKYRIENYHRWEIRPNLSLTLAEATNSADALLTTAVGQQMESDVRLATLLSGGIDSSLVSTAAQKFLGGSLQTFNVRFPDKEFDETWAAMEVAKTIHSRHEILDMADGQGTWDFVTTLLIHTGQPFADTSLFAVNRVCRLLRQHVKVALSGDGGDEGFVGYNLYWQLEKIAQWQVLPSFFWRLASVALEPLTSLGSHPQRLARQLRDLTGADNTGIMQYLFCWVREKEHQALCRDMDLLPIRRLFEPHWEHSFSKNFSRKEQLSAHATEVNVRMTLANDFLFKVDMASMREGLEIRVPMLDEEFFAFGLSLPHQLKVEGKTCKRVLREIGRRHLPPDVANKPKMGFGIPVDRWVDSDFKVKLRETLLGPSSRLPEFFHPETYRPILEAFCGGGRIPEISRQGLYQRAIMLLAVHLAVVNSPVGDFNSQN